MKISAEILVRIRSSLLICNVTHVRYTRLYLDYEDSMSRIEVLFYCFLFIVRQYYAH